MIEMTFNLDNPGQQPVFCLEDFHNIKVLLDTGSELPIWIGQKESLLELGAKKDTKSINVYGVTGKKEIELYRIDIKFGQIIYKDMPIFLNPITTGKLKNVQMVFGASNFRDMIYTIDTIEGKLHVKCPKNQVIYNVKALNADGTIDILTNSLNQYE